MFEQFRDKFVNPIAWQIQQLGEILDRMLAIAVGEDVGSGQDDIGDSSGVRPVVEAAFPQLRLTQDSCREIAARLQAFDGLPHEIETALQT